MNNELKHLASSNNQSPSVRVFDNLITILQLSQWTQVPEKTIRDWVYKRKIPFKKVGRHIRFLKSEIELWIQKGNDPNAH
jgi:excisionase family DNA binding protein